jgi:hypothetical protein
MWNELKRIIKNNGAIALFGSEPFSSALRMSNIKQFKYDWIWQKDNGQIIAKFKKTTIKKYENISILLLKKINL